MAACGVPINQQFLWSWPCNLNLAGECKCQSFQEPSPLAEEPFSPGERMRQLWFTALVTSLSPSEKGRQETEHLQMVCLEKCGWPVIHVEPKGRRRPRGLLTWPFEAEEGEGSGSLGKGATKDQLVPSPSLPQMPPRLGQGDSEAEQRWEEWRPASWC